MFSRSTGMLMAGVGKRCITPTPDMLPFRSNLGGAEYKRVWKDIFVRVLALSNGEDTALFVGFDLTQPPEVDRLAGIIGARFGVDPIGIVVSGTMSHMAPRVGNRNCILNMQSDPREDEYVRWYHSIAVEAVGDALSCMQPAEIGFGIGHSEIASAFRPLIGQEGRLNYHFDQYLDPELDVCCVRSLKHEPIALYVNYGMNSATSAAAMAARQIDSIGGDIPGCASQMLEEALDGSCIAIWAVSCDNQFSSVGSGLGILRPRGQGRFEMERAVLAGEDTFKLLEAQASRHFVDILRTLDAIRDYTCELELAFGERISYCEGRPEEVVRRMRDKLGIEVKMNDNDEGRKPDPSCRPGNEMLSLRSRLVCVNNAAFASVNVNPYNVWVRRLRDALPFSPVFSIPITFGNNGHLPDPQSYRQGYDVNDVLYCDVVEANDLLLDNFIKMVFEDHE